MSWWEETKTEAINAGITLRHLPSYVESITGWWSFDREKAVKYANKHWNDPPFYGDNDCTNFVSQCWAEGGIPITTGWHGDRINIEHDFATQSWWDAVAFADYMEHKYCQILHNINEANIGDAIQFYNPEHKWHHTSIIVIKSESDVYYAAHSRAREHKSLQEAIYETGEKVRFLCPLKAF